MSTWRRCGNTSNAEATKACYSSMAVYQHDSMMSSESMFLLRVTSGGRKMEKVPLTWEIGFWRPLTICSRSASVAYKT
jgi:hypothetical protein